MAYQQFQTLLLDWGMFYVEVDSDDWVSIKLSFCMRLDVSMIKQ